jgi:hypothetical protein
VVREKSSPSSICGKIILDSTESSDNPNHEQSLKQYSESEFKFKEAPDLTEA